GRFHSQGRTRSARMPSVLTARRSSRTAAIGRARSTEATPTRTSGAARTNAATSSFETSGPDGAYQAQTSALSTRAARIAATVASTGMFSGNADSPTHRRSDSNIGWRRNPGVGCWIQASTIIERGTLASEPGGEGVTKALVRALSDPRDMSVGPNQDG